MASSRIHQTLLLGLFLELSLASICPTRGHAQAPTHAVVKSSLLQKDCTSVSSGSSNCGLLLHIRAEIEGQDLELIAEGRPSIRWPQTALIAPGKYQVTQTRDEKSRPYLMDKAYDFTFANGDKQHFIVIGVFAR